MVFSRGIVYKVVLDFTAQKFTETVVKPLDLSMGI